MGVVKYYVHCAVVAKPATLLPFGLAGSMPSFRSIWQELSLDIIWVCPSVCVCLGGRCINIKFIQTHSCVTS